MLVLAALAERAGAHGIAFYLFVLGIAVSAAGGLSALDRLTSATDERAPTGLDRFRLICAAAVVGSFFVGAAATSPVVVDLRAAAPGLPGAAIVLGLLVVAAQGLAGLAGEREDEVRVDRGLLSLDADAAQRPHLGSVR